MAEISNSGIHGSGIGLTIDGFQLYGDTNNLDVKLNSFVTLNNTSGGLINLTGAYLGAPNGSFAHSLIVYNISSNDIVLKHNDILSSIGNRFFNKSGLDIVLGSLELASFYHVELPERHGWIQA